MNAVVTRSQDDLQALIAVCWGDVWRSLGELVEKASITWGVEESEHFKSDRGFATTTHFGGERFHLKFAERALSLPQANLHAILRHEMGHVVDLLVAAEQLPWADLPCTPERRADSIAAHIWGTPIYYDENLVQTTEGGTAPRPEELGL